MHVPLQSLRNCSLTESGRFRGDFLQAESAVLPKGTKLCPSKCNLSPSVQSWGMLLRGLKLAGGTYGGKTPWRAIPGGLLGLSPTLSIGGGGHGQAKVLPSSPRMSAHGRKPDGICQRQLGEPPVNVLPSERAFCSLCKVSPLP